MPSLPIFASYAQADRQRHLEKFIEDLREQVRGRLGENDGTGIVFFDRDGLNAGDIFTPKIMSELQGAKVLVCLMSPTYFRREWCGRELQLFLARLGRLQLPPGVFARFIFPVWWQLPAAPRPLPSALGQFHYHDAGFPRDYSAHGALGLARTRRRGQLNQLVDTLAVLICQTLQGPHHLPLGEPVPDITAIANAFDEQQPYDVRLLSLTPNGSAWAPGAADVSVAEAAALSAQQLQVYVRPLHTREIETALKEARDQHQVLLLVTTTPSDQVGILQTLDQNDLPNLAILAVEPNPQTARADEWFAQFKGALSQASEAGLLRVATPGNFATEMQILIDKARQRLRLRANQNPARAEDETLSARAREEGIETKVQPHLSGPGLNS